MKDAPYVLILLSPQMGTKIQNRSKVFFKSYKNKQSYETENMAINFKK